MHRHFPQAVINTIQVPSLADTLVKVEAGGGTKIHGPMEIPGVGTHAYCTDPDGTFFGLLEPTK
jgi:predicted enzyme related to lactoylglutathione lyase